MIQVQLTQFEGPLSLLLYLVRKEDMDIFDINIQEITQQYLEYIRLMKELDLEFAGDFVAMAATLIQIKSKMLLPQYDENGEIVEQDDPRKELVQRLLEYQKYQEASKLLSDRPWLGRDLFVRGSREDITADDEPAIELDDKGLFGLIASYHRMMRAAKKRVHSVSAKVQSVASRIMELKDRLLVGQRITLEELIGAAENRSRQLLITFLSVLELGKLGFVSLYQGEPYSDIHIETKKPIESEVISSVEEYDNIHADDVAQGLFAKAEAAAAREADAASVSEGNADENDIPIKVPQLSFEEMDDESYVLEDDEGAGDEANDIASDEEILNAEMELREHEQEEV